MSLVKLKREKERERDSPSKIFKLPNKKVLLIIIQDATRIRITTYLSREEVENEYPEGWSTGGEVGGPFSALTPSMWPVSLLKKKRDEEIKGGRDGEEDKTEIDYDEFGFRIDEEDGPEDISNRLRSSKVFFDHEEKQRLKWIAHLEFSSSDPESGASLCWDSVVQNINKTETLRNMVLEGIPHSCRAEVWKRLASSMEKKNTSQISYKQIVRSSSIDHLMTSKQIEKDLLRTIPTNICFSNPKSIGIPRLRRILRGLAWLFPEIGYCQGMGMIVAMFLLIMEEEDTFWIMTTVIENLLPSSYFSPSLIGVQADQLVLRTLIASILPELEEILSRHDIELALITLNWFLTLFSSVLHVKIILRIWDVLLFDGSKILFQVSIAMLKMNMDKLLKAENCADVFNILSMIPSTIDDADELLRIVNHDLSSISDVIIETHRRRHLAVILSEQGSWKTGIEPSSVGPPNRRSFKRSKSFVENLLPFGNDDGSLLLHGEDRKNKNIRQTECLVLLREAILRIARYFEVAEPNVDFDLNTDYSAEAHKKDIEVYMAISQSKLKRARAIVDFERNDDDELGFLKKMILLPSSIRKTNIVGWGKSMNTLDGDDSVNQMITDLVRGIFCPALKNILDHGLKKSSLLLGPCHPWLFIQEAANGKVLSPEELLFRCVELINYTHDPMHAQMDVKLRSLVCLGLNEQVLHLWLEALASNEEIVKKWYQDRSFMNSPGWVQVKCELRILAQFSFTLNPDWELSDPKNKTLDARPLKDGVRDMLVKHHLFSWDL
ncbi:SGSM3 [Lepeophtheirus salmonis]|uniref:SGSM3 n=1 Tax=Lepeophtheirus salmonis TaxID=72036 RepID=A0A7R8CJW5_LEPSM|nr:SGSM3 [Lepeophtheirus salmonis]CAF2845334.1 SGSM3 [Lepeophtheirus salmonis]